MTDRETIFPGGSRPGVRGETAVPLVDVELTVNGTRYALRVPATERLADLLRDRLGLTGTKLGCEVGSCGVCTVIVDGKLTSSCLLLAAQAHDSVVRTVEGLARDPQGRRLQQAFICEGAFQCGFCTSGQLVAAAFLAESSDLSAMDDASRQRAMEGNLCRCTGYYGILRALDAFAREGKA